jgi:membrane protein DedA with SNARE-associated domain
MAGFEDIIRTYLLEISHYPVQLYIGVILILFASSFGLPLPEEVVLLTSGAVAYLALAESRETGLPPDVSPELLATICFAAVFLSDLLVFSLGRRYGIKVLRRRPFSLLISGRALARVRAATRKYGAWACAIFRFTPGIRFPGHFICGSMKISYTTFFLTDGVAALLTVPTQVMFMAYYGDEILVYIKQLKVAILIMFAVAFLVWFFYIRRLHQNPIRK